MDLQQLSEEVAPLVLPYKDEISAVRFDALIYAIELGYVAGNIYTRGIKDLKGKVRAVAKVGTIPAVQTKNGMMKDFAVMQEPPFTDKGDVGDIFDDVVVWLDIMKIIKSINKNALAG